MQQTLQTTKSLPTHHHHINRWDPTSYLPQLVNPTVTPDLFITPPPCSSNHQREGV
ncbi:hypothetical protein HanRHA438_Chr13g0578571 [Helianthus annuus]|uniref:Uncharacterized protein n=1 Tax=Helianthus annuus TaxID=4232 RepID=A0A251SMQ1_HELAN|nr:hypothetical protein HanXRQr2_Chr13g0566791 [Helianthus annuus]KAJ0847496.1 hypothetical protein HanPSC8_Chr13g0545961 [Helianthus annuus]KAJ0856447.1 hypothetical protein HanRHA438_Chr13g0578571 [Helianthus annuus]